MKVCVSVLGRFHAFDLARELSARGALARLVTSYPRSVAQRFGVPREDTESIVSTELMKRGWSRLPAALRGRRNLQNFFHEHFEARVAMRMPRDVWGADLFVGWSGCSLAAIERARELGLVTVVERGSSHIEAQSELVREEYERYGLEPRIAHPATVEKELREYEEADFIGIPSGFVRDTFLARGVPESKLLHVPYGVSLDAFSPPPAGTRERARTFRILHVGGVNLRKGCHHLLEAFRMLDLPNAELHFVGPVAPEMQPFRERWSSDRIVFHEPVPQARLVEFYADAQVFALASIEEGLAMVTAQAMACGLPIVATVNTGAADLVNEGSEGFLVPIRSPEAIAERLTWLHEHPQERFRMGSLARERVEAGFTWSDYGERALAAYRRAVDAVHRNDPDRTRSLSAARPEVAA